MSTKSLGFCFKQGKEKTKQKDFAMCATETKNFLNSTLRLVATSAKKKLNEINIENFYYNSNYIEWLYYSRK
jgi:hypothetical protein